MGPILSIVIPTKNRYYYLEFLVKYFHSINSDKIELIIQDNSASEPSPSFKSFLNSLDDSRLFYSYCGLELSVVENCDLAIRRAHGEYVTLIGDDDIFSKHLIKYLENCSYKQLDAILPNKGSYNWPDINARFYKNKLSGIFRQKKISGQQQSINANTVLERVLKRGGTQILDLPRVYHGVVRRNILEQVFKESGSYFPGPSPDMSNAIALCKYVKNYITIDIPFVISGHSISSTGGQGAQGRHFGEVSEIKHLPKDTASKWSSEVPFYWSGYTIYAESVKQSLVRMNMSDYIQRLNLDYLYSTCLVFDTTYRTRVINTMRQQRINSLSFRQFKIYYYFISIWIERLLFHLRNNLVLLLPGFVKPKGIVEKKANILEVAVLNDNLIEKRMQKSLESFLL